MPDVPPATTTNNLTKLNTPPPFHPPAEEKERSRARQAHLPRSRPASKRSPRTPRSRARPRAITSAGRQRQGGGAGGARPGAGPAGRRSEADLAALGDAGALALHRAGLFGGHSDGKIALNMDPKNWAAFELYMYSLDKCLGASAPWPWPRPAGRGPGRSLGGRKNPACARGAGPWPGKMGRAGGAGRDGPCPTQEELTADRSVPRASWPCRRRGWRGLPRMAGPPRRGPFATYEVLMKSMKARKEAAVLGPESG